MLDNTFKQALSAGMTNDMRAQVMEPCRMAELLDMRYGRDSWVKDCHKLNEEVGELYNAFADLTRTQVGAGTQALREERDARSHFNDMGLGIMIEGAHPEVNVGRVPAAFVAEDVHRELSDVIAVVMRMVYKMSRATGIPFKTLLANYCAMAKIKADMREIDPMWGRQRTPQQR